MAGPVHQERIRSLYVPVDEDALPRHEHVIKDRKRVLFIKSGRHRPIEGTASGVVWFPADEFETLRVDWDRKAKGVAFFTLFAGIEWPDPDFVGERGQRREHASASNYGAAVGLPNEVQRCIRIDLLGRSF